MYSSPESLWVGIGDIGQFKLRITACVEKTRHAFGEPQVNHKVSLDIRMWERIDFFKGQHRQLLLLLKSKREWIEL